MNTVETQMSSRELPPGERIAEEPPRLDQPMFGVRGRAAIALVMAPLLFGRGVGQEGAGGAPTPPAVGPETNQGEGANGAQAGAAPSPDAPKGKVPEPVDPIALTTKKLENAVEQSCKLFAFLGADEKEARSALVEIMMSAYYARSSFLNSGRAEEFEKKGDEIEGRYKEISQAIIGPLRKKIQALEKKFLEMTSRVSPIIEPTKSQSIDAQLKRVHHLLNTRDPEMWSELRSVQSEIASLIQPTIYERLRDYAVWGVIGIGSALLATTLIFRRRRSAPTSSTHDSKDGGRDDLERVRRKYPRYTPGQREGGALL